MLARVLGAVAITVALLAAPASAHALELPAGFEEHDLVQGLTRPTAVAWAPDGRTFVVEKDGRLKVAPSGSLQASTVLDLRPEVNSYSDRGMLGVAVDADFANNGFVYVLYTRELAGTMMVDQDGPMVSQLRRVKLGATNAVLDQAVILGTYPAGPCPAPSDDVDCIPSEGSSHSIGTVLADPDGTLWVGSGDAAEFNAMDPKAFRTYDERSMAGKIMHIDREGSGLPGHAFCPSEADLTRVCTKLHAKGFRNPFRFSLRPGGGLTVGDVGWNRWEEVNLVGASGRSYGWPCYEGRHETPGYRDDPACDPEYAKEGGPQAHLEPDHEYPHDPVTSGAVLGGPTYTADAYPAGYRGSIFIGDYAQAKLERLAPTPEGGMTAVPFASDWYGVGLSLTPQGDLAYVSFGDGGSNTGAVKEIVYSPGNARPVAVATADRSSGPAPLPVQFDASGSEDADNDPLTYLWDFGDGATSTQQSPTHTYDEVGSYSAQLTVSDGRGKSGSDTIEVDAGNSPPVLDIEHEPSYRGGDQVRLQATAHDEQDGALPDTAIDWDVQVIHGNHIHFENTVEGARDLVFEARDDHDLDSHYEIVVRAEDSHERVTQEIVTLAPEPAPLLLDSEPGAVLLSYAGRDALTPFTRQAAVGFRTSISAPPMFERGGARYGFSGWSDSAGPPSRQVVVPPQGLDLRALYRDATPAAAAPRPAPPAPADRTGPKIVFKPRRGFDPRRGLLRGTAGDPAGVARVEVALGRRYRTQTCGWWLPRKGRLSAGGRSCRRVLWIRARLRRSGSDYRWVADLRRKNLPAGAYRLLVRAVDREQNATQIRSCVAAGASCR